MTTKTLDLREYLTFNALEGVSRYNCCIWMKVDRTQVRFVLHSWQPFLKLKEYYFVFKNHIVSKSVI